MGFLDFLFKKTGGSGKGRLTQMTHQTVQREWENIEVLLKGGQPSQLRQALISADKSVDTALKDLVVGETMGERLKNAKDQFEWNTYQKIWEAHKVRNALVHEAGYEPPYYVLQEAIQNLKNGLIVLGIRV